MKTWIKKAKIVKKFYDFTKMKWRQVKAAGRKRNSNLKI